MQPGEGAEPSSNVVPLPVQDGSVWAEAQARLLAQDAATYGAWFHALTEAGLEEGCLTLMAPTRFHATYVAGNLRDRLLAVLRRIDPTLSDLRIIS